MSGFESIVMEIVLYIAAIPIEAKYRRFSQPKVTRGFRSFIEAYQPKHGFIITKDYYDQQEIAGCLIEWLPVEDIQRCFQLFDRVL